MHWRAVDIKGDESSMMNMIQELIQYVTKMQWADYLDIVVVAFLIYMLLPLIRTPNMMRLARMVVLVVIVAWLANYWKLRTFSWILNQVLAVGLLAFVILFQPELRRVLMHLSDMTLSRIVETIFGTNPSGVTEAIITQTIMACQILSRQKVGALIVFSRQQRLDEYFKSGTVVDAAVSEQLLRNIFFPKAALHDGAVIVQDGRIAAAGCVLPLSDSSTLSADLGTRHRAGVGITEVSDAVTIIVSEETGGISVAVGGMLKQRLELETLDKLLRKELSAGEEADPEEGKRGLLRSRKKKEEAGSYEKK